MNILGISAFYHDSAAALMMDGRVVAAAQEERFSRIKHDASTPLDAAEFCLAEGGITMDEVDHVVFYEKPLRKFERLLMTHLRNFPRGGGVFAKSMGKWLGQRLWMKGQLADELDVDMEKILFCEHHLSHAAVAFFTSPFERAAVITADGVGEWATSAIYHGVKDAGGIRLAPVKELHFPHSMGLLYSVLTAYLGFKVNNGEYKVMGLASYGTPRYLDAFEKLCTIEEDGTITLDMSYFSFQRDRARSFTPKLETLLGPARNPGDALDLPAEPGTESARWADIAASLQAICERYMFAAAQEALRETGERDLCLAGGIALNSVANGRLAEAQIADRLYVPPAAGDTGGALGAALYTSHVVFQIPVPEKPPGVFLGKAFSQDKVEGFFDDCRVRYQSFDTEDALLNHVADRLAQGEVGGWFQGRFEWGPRALGARSILADPRQPEVQERVNRKIKFREHFRPFAPAVMEADANQLFELDSGKHAWLTPSMLSVVPVKPKAQEMLGAVTHVDGSARVQTVNKATNPRFHRLLEAFKARTGLGCLLNTSMNLKGEPMCASPGDAYAMFDQSGLDFLVVERCLVERQQRATSQGEDHV